VPLTCFVLTLLLARSPVPAVLLLTETARKVVSYSFAKPAREMIFTQVPPEVKYKSKLVLDTVVQRAGDTLGAALFSCLGVESGCSLSLSLSRVRSLILKQRSADALRWCCAEAFEVSSSWLAAGCATLSMLWALVAYTLGRRFDLALKRSEGNAVKG
jgi:hypothetical protein